MQDEFRRLQSVLKKTIVFITHDFDEAIRLADRIAIMKDGAVVQAGTAQDLVLAPADAYVAEFTRDVPKAKVIKVGSVMKPAPPGLDGAAVPANAAIADVAARFSSGSDLLRVEDAEGRTAGVLHRADVVDILMRG
jgi:glycine betaine/proline transport system ATP-binding protein